LVQGATGEQVSGHNTVKTHRPSHAKMLSSFDQKNVRTQPNIKETEK